MLCTIACQNVYFLFVNFLYNTMHKMHELILRLIRRKVIYKCTLQWILYPTLYLEVRNRELCAVKIKFFIPLI